MSKDALQLIVDKNCAVYFTIAPVARAVTYFPLDAGLRRKRGKRFVQWPILETDALSTDRGGVNFEDADKDVKLPPGQFLSVKW